MNPLIGSALIGGASSLLGGLFGGRARDEDREYQERINQQQLEFARQQRQDNLNFVQNRVKDAQKAGIHPLFAMGAPGFPGTSLSLDSGPVGGAGVGEGIARAGQVAAESIGRMQPKALANAHLRQVQSQTEANSAQAAYYRSLAAKTSQEALTKRTAPLAGLAASQAMAQAGVQAVGDRVNRRFAPPGRETEVRPHVDASMFSTIVGPSGREYAVPSEASQADEFANFSFADAVLKEAMAQGLNIWNKSHAYGKQLGRGFRRWLDRR